MADTPRPEPTTQAGRDHDADWRNLLRMVDVAVKHYASSKGRVIPEMEMLSKALGIIGPIESQHPALAIEAEARDATGLREEAVAVLTLGGRMPSGSGYLPNRGDAVASLRRIAGYEPLRDAAALAAAPPEPRTITEKVDAIEAAIHPEGRCVKCGGGKPYWKHVDAGQPVADFHEFQPPPEPRWPSRDDEAIADQIVLYMEGTGIAFQLAGEGPFYANAREVILAALREGGERP